MRIRWLLPALALAAWGCGEVQESAPEASVVGVDSVALRTALDSGNAAFRQDDPSRALEFYREATRVAPEAASAWFGVYMAARATGDDALADSALARTRTLSPALPGAHPSTADSALP